MSAAEADEARIFAKVAEILAANLGKDPSEIALEHGLRKDLELDSLDIIELAIAAETAFDISIPEEELGHIQTVLDVVTYLKFKIGG